MKKLPYKCGPEAKYNFGDAVLINGNVAGIILYQYNMFADGHDPWHIYRVIVDGHDLAHRCRNNHINQIGDDHLFDEDFNELRTSTPQINVIDCSEDELTKWSGETLTTE